MPAANSNIGHTRSYAEGGPNDDDNLAPLCLKHDGWTYKIRDDGEIVWTSPLGHRYAAQRAPP